MSSFGAVGIVGRNGAPPAGKGLPPENRPATLDRAEAFLLANIDEPLSVDDVARATGASARTLYRTFQTRLGRSPMEHLRLLRLEGARAALSSPEPDATVTLAAMQWGFSHLGRFAGSYRRTFGESPSQTLRRSRVGWSR